MIQAQPIVWMDRCRQYLSRTRLHPREHEGIGIGIRIRTSRPPQVNRLAHGLGDRDKPVIGTSVAVLAFDFLALQPTTHWLNEECYVRKIQPQLGKLKVREIAQALQVSQPIPRGADNLAAKEVTSAFYALLRAPDAG